MLRQPPAIKEFGYALERVGVAAAAADRGSGLVRGRNDRADRLDAVVELLRRLEADLVSETLLLARGQLSSLKDSSIRKSQYLLELTRALRGLDMADVRQLSSSLSQLRRAAESNRDRLNVEMQAARSVTSMIAKAIQDSESDGTYCALTSKRGNDP